MSAADDKAKANKPKAEKVPITQLMVTSAYAKTFTSGKTGFFGKAIDPHTGDEYQIIGAVKIAR